VRFLPYTVKFSKRSPTPATASSPAHQSGHGDPRIHLAINLVHLLATIGAVIETTRELCEWLHLF
jgi:hypothetical protein